MFIPYRGYLSILREFLKQQGNKLRRQNVHREMLEMFRTTLRYNPRTLFQPKDMPLELDQDSILILIETVHYLLTHRVYCVSTALAERLAETEMELSLDNLNLPSGVFEVCFDDAFEIMPGVKAPGVLVLCTPGPEIISALAKFAKEATGQDGPMRIAPRYGELFSLRFKSPFDDGIMHMTISVKDEKGKPIDEIVDGLGRCQYSWRLVDASGEEKEVEKRLMRIVLGIICYLNTVDPESRAYMDRNRPSYSERPAELFLLGEHIPREVSWHLRKGHFRFLRSERFKRDDSGKVRCVWVRASEVNRDKAPVEIAAKVEHMGDEIARK